MTDKQKRDYLPILGNGEQMIEPIKKKMRGGEKPYPRSYDEAKNRIKRQLEEIQGHIKEIPEENRMDEIVLTLRLNEDFLAKTYIPDTFFKKTRFENIGSRRWVFEKDSKMKYSKMHFVKVDQESLSSLQQILDSTGNALTKSFKNDIRKIEEFSLLRNDEIIQGFDDDWMEGTVEFVLHPYGHENEEMIEKFKRNLISLGVKGNTIKLKTYDGGPTFVSALVNRKVINNIANFNPLRTVHPLKINFFPELRGSFTDHNLLLPPLGENISQIKVGVFDGGINPTHPFLAKFSKENKAVSSNATKEGIKHGTAVAGVVLYGDLNQYEANSHLDDPVLFVESFRVLPLSDPKDFDLYEAIEFIEQVVPNRHDIDVYNLSFGPTGPIFDDEISRFTYALDTLAWNYQKLFVVAVGNDGEAPSPYNRVQAPADLVNGLGVGAYTFNYDTAERIRASYSCIGDGREGCKVKPDVCAFGGDSRYPIHLINSSDSKEKLLSAGTSYSAPIISSKAAEILGRCSRFTPLVARALLIHTAQNPNRVDNSIGYGIIDQSVDEILKCDKNHVNIIYTNSMNPTGMAKLPIPLPLNSSITSNVNFSWTIATLSKANALHVEDYTESTIEDTFYPHDKKYNFTKKDCKIETFHIVEDKDKIQEFLSNGYQQSLLPKSADTTKYKTESEKETN
ncbi:S8 family peptidase [Paenibacillus larvae]|uniref:S8 family peptidase n=1 Tax=Paenibacillus larvae TaxID=1464 RepID=UPI00293C92E5|nr:S8 family peptidase [Paenibacillus larvae]MDV3433427.1 S8 family peptidase [Paenibacillus larvae]